MSSWTLFSLTRRDHGWSNISAPTAAPRNHVAAHVALLVQVLTQKKTNHKNTEQHNLHEGQSYSSFSIKLQRLAFVYSSQGAEVPRSLNACIFYLLMQLL